VDDEVFLVNDSVHHLQKRLETEGDKIAEFFLGLDNSAWDLVIYNTDAKWTLLHILKHFVSVEQAFQWLIQDVLAGGSGAPIDLEIDEFNQAEMGRLLEYQPGEIVQTFKDLRKDSISLTGTLTSEDLKKRGNHPYFGYTEIKKILKLLYTHNSLHMRDIRRVLRER
jgi:hypothetical protein